MAKTTPVSPSSLELAAKQVQDSFKKMEAARHDDNDDSLETSSQDSQDTEETSFDLSSQEDSFEEDDSQLLLDSTPAEFLLKPAIHDDELRAVTPIFRDNISKPLDRFNEDGYSAYKAYLLKEKEEQEEKEKLKEEQRLESLQDAAILGNPRDYQTALFEVAKSRNTVIHLGTGKGKTLIALLVIRHFEDAYAQGKQTLFLVPSVALAIQQTTTLQANLPYTVATACRTTTNNEEARQRLAGSNIIVATHGAMHDLLMHYEDIFRMERFNLVVLDECHYVSGNHVYAGIMQTWYHPLAKENRPHILGLTASPLLNVKHTHSDEQLETMLEQLEQRLDSKLVCLNDLNITNENGTNLLHKAAEETHVLYQDFLDVPPLPSCENIGLNQIRIREFHQLDDLYLNLGPLAVSIYCRICAREVSRNHFEKETVDEFRCVVQHLLTIAAFCEEQCKLCPHGGRSDKLMALEEQLERLIEKHGSADTVGLVFVDRRITALALHAFFRQRQKAIDQGTWTRAGPARRDAKERRDAEMAAVCGTFGKGPTLMIPDQSKAIDYSGRSDRFDDSDADYAGDSLYREPQEFTGRLSIPTQMSRPGQALPTIDGQFDDAEESGSEASEPTDHGDEKVQVTEVEESSVVSGQFSDASGDIDFDFGLNEAGEFYIDEGYNGERIRSSVMVRRATHVFRYLSGGTRNSQDDAGANEEWLHKETRIREVMRQLRKKEINVLFATSIVEEGVDVQACSFVIVFDSLKSAKSYIQMKGRARQTNARFVVLQNENEKKGKGLLALATAQVLERRVHSFVEKRETINVKEREDTLASRLFLRTDGSYEADELKAVEAGVYQAENGSVDLISAKGLLNKYAMAIPLDPSSRTTRESFQMHMPVFENYQLMLPAHLPTDVRLVRLPEKYRSLTPTERQQILALMACVRLHGLRLLSDRLLPLTRRDLHEELLRVATKEVRLLSTHTSKINNMFEDQQRQVFFYPIIQTGTTFSANQTCLGPKGNHSNRALVLLSTTKMPSDIPEMEYPHAQLGDIACSLGEEQVISMTIAEWEECASFYATLFNGRWRRRTGNTHFRKIDSDETQGIISPYIVGCLSSGKLDWAYIKKITTEANRTDKELKQAASSFSKEMEPRIWAPLYDPNVPYIAYGPSGLDCGAPFPGSLPGVKTFQDYFAQEREYAVSEESKLYVVQRLWYLQSESLESRKLRLSRTDEEEAKAKIPAPEQPPPSHGYQVCGELATVLLPIDACMEIEVSDAYMALLCAVLPQFLYHIDCNLIAEAFRRHCKNSLPCLGTYLEKVCRAQVVEALAAKSCRLEQCYDRLEWLGDAVLKLLQTDALLQTPDLRQWVQCLHEGDLTKLRSEMGCNERLADSCKHLGIDKFILSAPLERGKWSPVQLKLCPISEDKPMQPTEEQDGPGMKVCADVIEAFLGLIYLSSGYQASVQVAYELGISLPTDDEEVGLFGKHSDFSPRPALLKAVAESFGKESFESPQLIEEALTHPSAVYQDVSSYQRLEWVGDAVLCLAMREWIYFQYPEKEVGDLVNLESALVSNETLAYLSFQNGLHTFLNHRDQGLPFRLEHYEWCVKELGRGLWGTDPPKVISDVVEAILGAAHVDGGFQDGQNATLTILRPILDLLQTSDDPNCTDRLSNPKTVMHALAGEFLTISVSKEEDFARSNPNKLVWQGDQWRRADEQVADYVATVSCLGENVLSIVETTRKSARNRACAMVVALMDEDKTLLEKLQRVRAAIDLEKSHEKTMNEETSNSE